MNKAYNMVDGIRCYLTDLAGLNRLVKDRMEAAYGRKERLKQFVILGHWMTDSCGNFGKSTFEVDYRPTDALKGIDGVVSTDDLFRMFPKLSVTTNMKSEIPSTGSRCPECGKTWTLDDAHEARMRTEDRWVSLTPGRTVKEREGDFEESADGAFRFNPEPTVRNPRLIDTTPHPKAGEPGYPNAVNAKGLRYHHPPFENERLNRSYVAEEGDEALITVFIFEHLACAKERIAQSTRSFFQTAFHMAGVQCSLTEIPNEYCKCDSCGPWFIARTPAGEVKVGWRKRVINIDWSKTGRKLPASLSKEDVTKGDDHIHAWSREDAIRYFREVLA